MHTSAAVVVEWNCSDCTPFQLCPLEGQVLKLSHTAPYKEDCYFQCLPAGSFKQVLKIQGFNFKTPGILSIYITNEHPSLLGYSLLQHLISLQTSHSIQKCPWLWKYNHKDHPHWQSKSHFFLNDSFTLTARYMWYQDLPALFTFFTFNIQQ